MPAGEQPPAFRKRGIAVLGHLVHRSLVDQRADVARLVEPVARVHGADPGGECAYECIIDAALHVNAVGGDAALPAIAELGDYGGLERGVEIGILEDQQRGVATQFEREALSWSRRTARRAAPPIAVEPVKESFRTTFELVIALPIARAEPVTTLSTARRDARLLAQPSEGERGQRRGARGFGDDRAARRQRRPDLARQHGEREVPTA